MSAPPLKNPKAAALFAVELAKHLFTAPPMVDYTSASEEARTRAAALFEQQKKKQPSSLADYYPTGLSKEITTSDIDILAAQIALHTYAAKGAGVILNEENGFAATFAGTEQEHVIYNPKSGKFVDTTDLQQALKGLLNGISSAFKLYFVQPEPPAKNVKPLVVPLIVEVKKEDSPEETATTTTVVPDLIVTSNKTEIVQSEDEPTFEKEKEKDPAPKKRAYRKRPPPATTATEPTEKAAKVELLAVVEEASLKE